MKENIRFYYLIPYDMAELSSASAVLDMLRYDGAMVHSNGPEGFWLLSNKTGPCVERWRSFLIPVIQTGVHRKTELPPAPYEFAKGIANYKEATKL